MENFFKRMFGVDLQTQMERLMIKQFWRSWGQQPTEIRKKRMEFVRAMILEEEEIKKISISATGWCTIATEAVIKGDLDELKIWAPMFLFDDEKLHKQDAHAQEMRARFAKFRQICLDAIDHLTAVEIARGPDGETRSS